MFSLKIKQFLFGPNWFYSVNVFLFDPIWPIRSYSVHFGLIRFILSTFRHGKTGGSGQVRVGLIRFAGQTGHGSKPVIFKRVNRVAGQSGRKSGRVDPYFSNKFFFWEINAIYQLFMSFLTVIRFSLVILLPITTKHLI